MSGAILRVTGITKRFGSVTALDNVDFDVEQGEIHALLGTNGAGKSTLVKILAGVYTKDEGAIEIAGHPVEFATPHDAIENGVAVVQQHPELIPGLSGFENIFLGQEHEAAGLFRRLDRRVLRRRADALLRRFPVHVDLDRAVKDLTAVDREVIAVLHALTHDKISVLILDEPTSILTEREKMLLFRLMRALKAASIATIYITHRLEEVFEIADRFTIFRHGRNVATLRTDEASSQGLSLAELMLGEKPGDIYPPRNGKPTELLLETRGLTLDGFFRSLDLRVYRGEILGVFGLVGSGMDELSKVLFGILPPSSGTISLFDQPTVFSGPHDALRRGIFLGPGERRTEGLTLSRDVIFNMTLANLRRAAGLGGHMKLAANRRSAAALAERVDLRPPRLGRPAQTFSGGNQQKLVIARGLYAEAEIYIFVEPTVGVDVGARAKLYALLRELSKQAAVIVMSSDCDEVYGLSDRVIALYKGGLTHKSTSKAVTRDKLLMAGIMGAGELEVAS